MKIIFSKISTLHFRQLTAVFIFIFGVVFQLLLQKAMKPYAIDGYLFQGWNSEALMQTVSIEDLRSFPFETLANIHIQPPGLDFLRAIFVQFHQSLEITEALKQVDISIYILWIFLYALIGAMVFIWLEKFLSFWISFVLSIGFFFHPALIFYATLLDTTLLSSALVLFMYYFLWKVYKEDGSILPLIVCVIFLFFFRSIFQLSFIFVLGISLFLLRIELKRINLFLVATLLICGPYIIKQKIQFDLASTSSFSGINLIRSVNITEYEYPYTIDLISLEDASLPNILTRQKKLNGEINYNNLQYLEFNKMLIGRYKEYILEFHPKSLINSYIENFYIYFLPSSTYTEHVIVDRLPWRNLYDKLFSAPVFPVLLGVALLIFSVISLKKNNLLESLAFSLPTVYIFLICILFEKGENLRFKFFLEPVFFVFISIQFYSLCNWKYSFIKRYF